MFVIMDVLSLHGLINMLGHPVQEHLFPDIIQQEMTGSLSLMRFWVQRLG